MFLVAFIKFRSVCRYHCIMNLLSLVANLGMGLCLALIHLSLASLSLSVLLGYQPRGPGPPRWLNDGS